MSPAVNAAKRRREYICRCVTCYTFAKRKTEHDNRIHVHTAHRSEHVMGHGSRADKICGIERVQVGYDACYT